MLNSNEFSSAVVEGAGYQTKGDLPTSFDVDAFEVLGGRDEEWRFVSLRRLRGLHNGSFAESLKVVPQQTNVTAPEGVKVETVDGTNERLRAAGAPSDRRSEEHTSELQSRGHLVCRLLLEKKKTHIIT